MRLAKFSCLALSVAIALALGAYGANAKTIGQTESWLSKQFSGYTRMSSGGEVKYHFSFKECELEQSVYNGSDWLGYKVQLKAEHAKQLEITAENGGDVETYALNFNQVVVYDKDMGRNHHATYHLHRSPTGADMPKRILTALSYLVEKCTGVPPKAVQDNTAPDDLF